MAQFPFSESPLLSLPFSCLSCAHLMATALTGLQDELHIAFIDLQDQWTSLGLGAKCEFVQ